MMCDLILGLLAYQLAVLLFWCVAFALIQPVRLATFVLASVFPPRRVMVRPVPTNVIQFPGARR
jgi:hypothetical protein